MTTDAPADRGRPAFRWAALQRWEFVAAVALAVRLLYLVTARGPAFDDPLIDGDYFDALGVQLAQGHGFPPGAFWQPPLYPLFLGALYAVCTHNLWAPRLAQALFGALLAALTFSLAKRASGRDRVATIAGLLVALHGPLVFYDGELLATSLGTVLGAAALWLATDPAMNARRAAFAGALAGLAALAVAPVGLVALPAAWSCARSKRAWGAVCLLAGIAAIAPATIANRVRAGEWVAISANGGINLWIGNGPNPNAQTAIRPGAGWEELVSEPADAGITGAGARDAYFTRKALSFCARHPVHCGRHLLWKARLLLVAREIPRNEDLYSLRDQSPVLAALTARVGTFALPYALLVPLAAAGLVAWKRRRTLAGDAVVFALFVLALAPVVFFVTGRYRAPLAPALCVLSALGLDALLAFRARSARAPALAAVVGLVATLWPVHLAVDAVDFRAEADYAVGGRRARLGDDEGAVRAWQRALARKPDYREAGYNLGLALEHLGRGGEAVRAYDTVLRAHPDDVMAQVRRAGALLAAGEVDEAERAYRAMLAADEHNGAAWIGLAHIAFVRGDRTMLDGSLRHATEVLGADDPEVVELRGMLAAHGASEHSASEHSAQ